MVFLNKIKKN